MNNQTNKNESGINLLDLFLYLASKWKWFLLSVLICGGLAWLKYAYTPFVYFRQATVIIKDPSNKTSSAGLDRYDNLINKVNVANELLQFRSKKLMAEVVNRLHADVSYLKKQGLREIELYTQSPVKVNFPEALPTTYVALNVVPVDKERVKVSEIIQGEEGKTYMVNLNDTVALTQGKVVVAPTNFYNDAWKGETVRVQKIPVSSMVGYFLGCLGIRQEQDEASILTLSMKDNSPVRAEDVLNTLIDVYNETTINDKNKVAVNTANFINERLIIIERELGSVEDAMEDFKQSNRILDLGSAAGQYMGEQFNATGMELETQLQLADYIKDYLTDPTKEVDLIPSNTGISDGNIESQINQYNAMKLRRDKLIDDSSDRNPVVEELNNSLRAMKQTIVRSVDNHIVSLNVRREDAQNREYRAQARMLGIPAKERQMLSIERQQKIKESLYMFLLNRREENALTQAIPTNTPSNKIRLRLGLIGALLPSALSITRALLSAMACVKAFSSRRFKRNI